MGALHGRGSSAAVHLAIDSRPESVSVVRAMISGFADAVRMEASRFDDLRTAVSEACNNVVIHAYEGGHGPLWVELELADGVLIVRVLDRGTGIRRLDASSGRMRVGLALISALAARVQVESRGGGGTEVRMSFVDVGPLRDPGSSQTAAIDLGAGAPALLRGDVVVRLAPVGLLDGVLARVADVIAARAHLSVDRHSDLQLVADELAALTAAEPAPQAVGLAIAARRQRLDLELGPLRPGTWERFRRDRVTLERLTEHVEAVPAGGGELLRVGLTDARPVIPRWRAIQPSGCRR
jgi:serine/threonine-protein kinase RsbW